MKLHKARSLVVVCAAALAACSVASAAITGTAHDFSTKSWNPTGQFCIPCHAPHNAINATSGPIWDHAVTTQTFSRTSWEDGTTSTITLEGSSKLCLSCHDGLTAVDAFDSNAGSEFITGDAKIGTDLTDDHPIGVVYADANSHIYNPEADVADFLENGKVECGSCHYAHGGQDGKFLRVTIAGSELCRTCHTF